MECNIKEVLMDPIEREKHIQRLLRMEGLSPEKVTQYVTDYKTMLLERSGSNKMNQDDFQRMTGFLDDILTNMNTTGNVEANNACYSGLALTGVPADQRESLLEDHALIKEAVKNAGLRNYDPAEAPFNPQNQLVGEPQVVSDIDILMVAASRYFTFTNLAASSGGGMEERTANTYNKFPFVMVKKGKYVSRMTTGARRIILLEYENMAEQKDQITDVIATMREYQPGVGTCSCHGNTLVGFKDDKAVCLPGLVEKEFPQLKYDFAQFTK